MTEDPDKLNDPIERDIAWLAKHQREHYNSVFNAIEELEQRIKILEETVNDRRAI